MRRLALLVLVLGACTTAEPAIPAVSEPSTSPPATSIPATTTTPLSTTASTTTASVPPTVTLPTPDPSLVYDHLVATETFRPGLDLDVHAPSEPGPWPVVVTVHGGGWYGGDRSSMGLLADGLADRGMVVFNVTYRRAAQSGVFPGPVEDVVCAIAHAVSAAPLYTTEPTPLVVIGHSAGAHLAALAVTATGEFDSECPDPQVQVDGFVGLAGPYDTDLLAFLLEPWFGAAPDDDPDRWALGNPLSHVNGATEVVFLLLHGDVDQLVPISFTEDYRDALIEAGAEVELARIADAGHGEVNDPRVVGALIAEFVGSVQDRSNDLNARRGP